MRTKSLLKVLIVLVFACSTFVSKSQIKILTGFEGGSYYEMANDLNKVIPPNKKITSETRQVPVVDSTGKALLDEEGREITEDVTTSDTVITNFAEVMTSDGSYYNFLKLNKSNVDVTFLQYDVILYEELKDLKRKFQKTENIRILLSLGVEEIHLITKRDNDKINSLKDLKKKNVGIGSAMQGTNITAKFIKEKTGINWYDVEIPFDKAFRALMNDDIDAFFFVGAAPVNSLNKLSPTLKDQIKLVPIVDDKLKDAYEPATITADTYTWVDKDVQTYGVRSVMVASIADETPQQAEKLSSFLNAIKNNLTKLQAEGHPAWKVVNFKDNGIEWEFHDVAKKLMQ
ncbi:MAG: TAXI family TRAP transporter solute-binding subunit [Saprospiraceae bacterium]|nr:TAXI family TRAP transporter solute-binding subunit [Saprospiraceae bacterium]